MIKYGLLTADDEMASEHEVYDFLYGLVRLLKPKVIMETGCYKGGATERLSKAAWMNGIGDVWSCDTDSDMVKEAESKCIQLHCHILHCSGIDFITKHLNSVDFAFIDSSGDRVEEVAALQLAPGAVVVLHDSNRPQYQTIWTIRPWKAIWHIPTIQGITVFQAP